MSGGSRYRRSKLTAYSITGPGGNAEAGRPSSDRASVPEGGWSSSAEERGTSADHRTELGEPPPRVLLYSKPGCHLCDDARRVIAAVCTDLGEDFDEIDISSSTELMQRYGEEIPVTFVDGAQHDYWRVDAQRLRGALAG